MSHPTILIVGASARSAAASAVRAGLRPWCLDLFADLDLQRLAPVRAIPPGGYPHALAELLPQGPPGPWLYTGALENRPQLVRCLASRRPLWGNDAPVLRVARSPFRLARALRSEHFPGPAVRRQPPVNGDLWGDWLRKPVSGAGGAGIRFAVPADASAPLSRRHYYQVYLDGEPRSAVYVADGRATRFLGLTRQLVGLPWLGAAPFHYCGSVGPLVPSGLERAILESLGGALAGSLSLSGLFGVDGVWRNGQLWPVEVNPRYTASVEVLEHGLGVPALALHRRAFDPSAPEVTGPGQLGGVVGKAVLFARQALTVPNDGPWLAALRGPSGPWELPAFTDIPATGQRIDAGRPVLSLFARAASMAACEGELRRLARAVEGWLY